MCSPCMPGTGNCTDCVEGQFQDRAAQFECHYCAPGTISNYSNATECAPCAPGTYQPLGGQARCRTCPPFFSTRGNWGATTCEFCAAQGCRVSVGGQCGVGCGLNYFYDEQAALGKLSAPSTESIADADGCVRCAPGTLNAYLPCATAPSACFDPPPGN